MNMQHKIGDRFKLGPWMWRVYYLGDSYFSAERSPGPKKCTIGDDIKLNFEDSYQLDWIKEPATISKAARDEIVEWAKGKMMALGGHGELKDYLDSMVSDGE